MLIGIAGKFCSGKTTLCKLLYREYDNSKIFNFADKVKDIATDLFGMTDKDRTLLQNIGMKMREINKDVWVDYVINQCVAKDHIYIIGDVRYQNECEIIRQKGGITFYIERHRDLRLKEYEHLYGRLPYLEEETHPSEMLDPSACDYIMDNNTTITEVFNKIKNLL